METKTDEDFLREYKKVLYHRHEELLDYLNELSIRLTEDELRKLSHMITDYAIAHSDVDVREYIIHFVNKPDEEELTS